MPHVDPSIFGRHDRFDGKPGHQKVVPTKQRYVEADGSDIRLYRVYVYDPEENIEKIFLRDTLGVLFKDMADIPDDPDYLETLHPSCPERR